MTSYFDDNEKKKRKFTMIIYKNFSEAQQVGEKAW